MSSKENRDESGVGLLHAVDKVIPRVSAQNRRGRTIEIIMLSGAPSFSPTADSPRRRFAHSPLRSSPPSLRFRRFALRLDQGQVGVDHDTDDFLKPDLGFPVQLLLGFGRVTD